MHLQAGETGWLDAVPLLPDGAVVKAFHMSMLKEAKDAWQAAGRDPAKLRTCYRYGDRLVRAEWDTWEARKAHWRRQFAFFLDRSAAPYLPYIDWVEECNEYTATTTWTSEHDTRTCLGSAEAAAAVWNDEIRGRRYATHDGAVLDVPDIQLVLCNGPVSNWIHRGYFELAIRTRNRLGYHPYIKWWRRRGADGQWETGRDPTDWAEHSGLWNVMEQAFGLYPEWAFTEGPVPYQTAHWGWLHEAVCGADRVTLRQAYRLWLADCAGTRAYREGRADPGMWFTSGRVGWEWYQLARAELVMLAGSARELWQPGQMPQEGDDMLSPEARAVVEDTIATLERSKAELLKLLAPAPWWRAWPEGRYAAPGRPLAIPHQVMTFYRRDGTPHNPPVLTRPVTWTMFVVERVGDLLLVFDQDGTERDWYVRGQDVQPA